MREIFYESNNNFRENAEQNICTRKMVLYEARSNSKVNVLLLSLLLLLLARACAHVSTAAAAATAVCLQTNQPACLPGMFSCSFLLPANKNIIIRGAPLRFVFFVFSSFDKFNKQFHSNL